MSQTRPAALCGDHAEEEGFAMALTSDIAPAGPSATAPGRDVRVRDLRSALEVIASLGELVRIKEPVDPGYEVPNIIRTFAMQPECPAIFFENLRGYPHVQAVAGVWSGLRRASVLQGLPPNSLQALPIVARALRHPIPPVEVADAPCQENVVTDHIDLAKLVPFTHGALYVEHSYIQPLVISKNPVTGDVNVAVYRGCLQGPDTITVNGRWDRHMGFQLSDAKRAGAPMPVALCLGPDPLWFAAGAARLPYGASEWDLIGALRGEPVELVRAKTIDLLVPARAEIVIEGEIRPPFELGDDGPWPEYMSYLGMNIHPPVMHVTAVTYRSNPITYLYAPVAIPNLLLLPGPLFLLALKNYAGNFVVDATINRQALTEHAIIKVRKSEAHHEGLQFNVALAAFGTMVELDRVTDEDIDIHNLAHVEWAVATRCNPLEQVHILGPGKTHQINPICGARELDGLPLTRGKMIVDATIPWRYKVTEKKPGITFFTRSQWEAVDLTRYLSPEDAARWYHNRVQGLTSAVPPGVNPTLDPAPGAGVMEM
jgi:2,5-furandicarboxylate decarboxylase 1